MSHDHEDFPANASTTPVLADPFDSEVCLDHASCGAHRHGESADATPLSAEEVIDRAVEAAVVRAVFGGDEVSRRNFMKLVGGSAALAIFSSVFTLDAAKAWAKEPAGPPEKKDPKIGFIPITCGVPIIMADPMKFYEKHGLTGTRVVKAAGWAMIRDWAVSKEVDCAHMLSPMPLALTLGAGSTAVPF